MTRIKARYDGHALVPEQPLDLPIGSTVEVFVCGPKTDEHPLAKIAALAYKHPVNPDLPADGAAQHDHYLYGTPKQP